MPDFLPDHATKLKNQLRTFFSISKSIGKNPMKIFEMASVQKVWAVLKNSYLQGKPISTYCILHTLTKSTVVNPPLDDLNHKKFENLL